MGNVKDTIKKLFSALGGKFSKELGIDLSEGESTEIFKWFLASKLFGARIGTNIAIKTYREFERHGVLSPERIIETGWDGLVRILDDWRICTVRLLHCNETVGDNGGFKEILRR